MEILLILATGTLCMVCFYYGVKVGQTVSKGETVEAPIINPIEKIREKQAKQLTEMEQSRIDAIMRNIERYDGTGAGQEDVPRG